MASNYTTNYGLCQWEAGDQFVRSEFNQDNAKIDAALGRTESMAETAVHGLYNLTLQQYYEGKETGWHRALVFDGFLDDSLVDSTTTGLFRREGGLSLPRTGQGNVNLGYSSGHRSLYYGKQTPTRTASGAGRITGLKIKYQQFAQTTETAAVTWTVYRNNTQAAQGSQSLTFTPEAQEATLNLTPTDVAKGDTFYIHLICPAINCQVYSSTSNDDNVGGTILITSIGASTGTMVTPALDLPDRTALRAWARYSGGSLTLSAVSGGSAVPLTPDGTRETVNAAGAACTEAAFSLDSGLPLTGTLTFRLDLALNGASEMTVFDYGLFLL